MPLHMGEDVFCCRHKLDFLGLHAPFLQLFHRPLQVSFSFRGGKLPHPRQKAGGWPPADSQLAVAHQKEYGPLLYPAGLLFRLNREFSRNPLTVTLTQGVQGTNQAFWLSSRYTDSRAEFHHSLVEIPWAILRLDGSAFGLLL